MKKSKLFLAVLSLPFLMGNSPAPYAYPNTYEAFTLTDPVLVGQDDERFNYQIEITNTGNGFIDLESCYFYKQGEGSFYPNYSPLYKELIGPNQTKTVIFESSVEDISNYVFSCDAYQEYERDIFQYSSFELRSKTYNATYDENDNAIGCFHYSFIAKDVTKLKTDTDDRYYVIYSAKYNGEEHYFYSYSIKDWFDFVSTEDLTASDIEIHDFYFMKYNNYKGSSNLLLTLLLCTIIPIVVIVILSISLVLIVTVIIRNIHRKKNCKNKNINRKE